MGWRGRRAGGFAVINFGDIVAGAKIAESGKDVHGAGMPVVIASRSIETHSRPGHAVLEPFAGTGTTLIAAEMTGRAYYATELFPAYCDIAVKRWAKFTGRDAVLANDGRTLGA